MKGAGLAVLGTDTGVGKTIVTAGLALAFMRIGIRAAVFKPVASGGVKRPEGWVSGDALWLMKVLGIKERVRAVNPVCYRLPLAPWIAAQEEKRKRYSPATVMRAYERIRRRAPLVLIEGVGGVLVPLSARESVADLCARMGAKAILVARAGLGTINHTLLSIAALRSRRVRPVGIIMNLARGKHISEATNALALERLSGLPVLATLPAMPGIRSSPAILRRLARMLPAGRLRRLI